MYSSQQEQKLPSFLPIQVRSIKSLTLYIPGIDVIKTIQVLVLFTKVPSIGARPSITAVYPFLMG